MFELYEWNPKQFLNLYPDPKKSSLGPKKTKKIPKIKSNSKVRIEGSIENCVRKHRQLRKCHSLEHKAKNGGTTSNKLAHKVEYNPNRPELCLGIR